MQQRNPRVLTSLARYHANILKVDATLVLIPRATRSVTIENLAELRHYPIDVI